MLYEKIFGQKLEEDLFANSLCQCSREESHRRGICNSRQIFETAAKNRVEANSIYVHTSIAESRFPSNYYSRQRSCPVNNFEHSMLSNRSSINATKTSRFQLQTRQCFLKVRTEHRCGETRTAFAILSMTQLLEGPFDSRLRSLRVSSLWKLYLRRKNESRCSMKSRMVGGKIEEGEEESNEMAVD